MKHVGENHRSRWRDFLSTDGEKPDRDREGDFSIVYHTGQVVLLARHFRGDEWQTLSIAPGKTDEYNAAMRRKYGDW